MHGNIYAPVTLAHRSQWAPWLLQKLFSSIYASRKEAYPLTFTFLKTMLSQPDLLKCMATTSIRLDNLKPALDWRNAERELARCMGAQNLSLDEVISSFGIFMRVLPQSHSREFDWIQANFYSARFYPLAEHLVYALKESGVFRRSAIGTLMDAIDISDALYCDMGVGSGVLFADVLSNKPGWTGIGLDIGQPCLEYTRAMLRHDQVSTACSLLQADIRHLPFENDRFDVITAVEVLEHVPAPAEAVSEIARVLKRGAHAVLGIPVQVDLPTHLFCYPSLDDAHTSLKSAGLAIEREIQHRIGGPSSDFFILCRKGDRTRA